jgi:hypothetical protein
MEILSELFDIDKKVFEASEPIEKFRFYRFQRRLFDKDGVFGVTDQFAPG